MRTIILLIISCNLTFAQTDIYSLSESIQQLSNRYSTTDSLNNQLKHADNISVQNGPRAAMISDMKSKKQIDSILILVENSSSGETYSYYAVALVVNSKGQAFSYTYQYYSGTEKSDLNKLKKKSDLGHFNILVEKQEYDTLEKRMYPSDLIIVSYRDSKGQWNYRLSRHPTKMIGDFINDMD